MLDIIDTATTGWPGRLTAFCRYLPFIDPARLHDWGLWWRRVRLAASRPHLYGHSPVIMIPGTRGPGTVALAPWPWHRGVPNKGLPKDLPRPACPSASGHQAAGITNRYRE